MVEERVSELENWSVVIVQLKEKTERKQSLKDLWDAVKYPTYT